MIEALRQLADAQEATENSQGTLDTNPGKYNPETENAQETLKNGDTAGIFSNAVKKQLEADQKEAYEKQERKEKAKQERKEHKAQLKQQARDATASSATLKAKILIGLQQGVDIYELFILAIECIGKATGDTVIVDQAKRDIVAVYGQALGQPGALQTQLNEVNERLATMKKNLDQCQDKERVRNAIKRHEELAQELEKKIKRSY